MNLKKLVQNFLPTWNGRLAVHYVCYNGNGSVHRSIPYATSTSPANLAGQTSIIKQQLELIQEAGFDVVIATWQGVYAAAQNVCANNLANLCQEFGLQFCYLLDPWCAKLSASGQNNNFTANVTASLQAFATQSIINSSVYVPEKYVLDFATGADLVALGKTFPTLKFLAMNQGFSWITIPSITESKARNAAAISNLQSQNKNSAMKIPALCDGFDDSGQPLPVGVATQALFDADGGKRDLTSSAWGGAARILDSFSGLFLQQQLSVTPATAPLIAFTTWNDYDERSSGPLEQRLAAMNGTVWATS